MPIRTVKYNPGFLSEEDLVRSFVVRHTDLELIVQVVRENVKDSNQHVLVTGPRGMGKTTLALRVVAEVRRTEELNRRWYPLVFAEESYQVGTPGEFWLEALLHLGRQTNDVKWKRTYESLTKERDEDRLRERALAQLMDFADAEGKRLLLVVENVDMLLADQINDDDAWVLRHTLQHEPRIMLLATAASRFEEIQGHDKAMFELFKPHKLHPLSKEECREVWVSITKQEPTDGRIRPIQILTGGNPRLVAIISSFAAQLSFKELMTDLMQLVDEHTEYFKGHLDRLPAVERKVYVSLVDRWKPATAREVAATVRLEVSKTSALLRRLVDRGAVVVADQAGRTKSYQVAERMYNIYYLMRRRGGSSGRVQALVNFMVGFYPPRELAGVITKEACTLEPDSRGEHYLAYQAILEDPAVQSLRQKILDDTPMRFFEGTDVPDSIKDLAKAKEWRQIVPGLLKVLVEKDAWDEKSESFAKARRLCEKAVELAPEEPLSQLAIGSAYECTGHYEQAEQAYRMAIKFDDEFAWAWGDLGRLLHERLNRYDEAEEAYRAVIKLKPEVASGWTQLGRLQHEHLQKYDEAETAYRRAIKCDKNYAWAWAQLGLLLQTHFERYDEAEAAYRRAIELKSEFAWGWANLGGLLHEDLKRYEEAEAAYRKAIELDADYGWAWGALGLLLHKHSGRYQEAEVAYRNAIKFVPAEAFLPWTRLGDLYRYCLGQYEQAEEAYRSAIAVDESFAVAWGQLGGVLYEHLDRPDEAESACRTLLQLAPELTLSSVPLLIVVLDRPDRLTEALKLADDAIVLNDRNPDLLATLARLFVDKGGEPAVSGQYESWAREAAAKEPQEASHQRALAWVLCSLGKWPEALEPARKVVEDTGYIKDAVDDTVDLFARLAAGGYAREALDILQDSPSAELLEPLMVGIRLFLGEKVNEAVEVLEVGKDVMQRILERQEKLPTEHAAPQQPAAE